MIGEIAHGSCTLRVQAISIYEGFPLLRPICCGRMRLIAFIAHRADNRQILEHIGVQSELPHITPALGPPLWDTCDAQMGEGAGGERSNCLGQTCFEAPNPCHTWPHALEFTIRCRRIGFMFIAPATRTRLGSQLYR